jgi:hypothetical protein
MKYIQHNATRGATNEEDFLNNNNNNNNNKEEEEEEEEEVSKSTKKWVYCELLRLCLGSL